MYRTKDGKWITRSQEIARKTDENGVPDSTKPFEMEEHSSSGSETDVETMTPKVVSVIDIVANRKNLLYEAKVQIGSMASSFLELPEERLHILQRFLKMMSGQVCGKSYL